MAGGHRVSNLVISNAYGRVKAWQTAGRLAIRERPYAFRSGSVEDNGDPEGGESGLATIASAGCDGGAAVISAVELRDDSARQMAEVAGVETDDQAAVHSGWVAAVRLACDGGGTARFVGGDSLLTEEFADAALDSGG